MSHVLSDYDFELPDAAIAQAPPPDREDARLLLLSRDSGALREATVRELEALVPDDVALVANDTRVVAARLWARKETGGGVELLLVRPFGPDGAGLERQEVLCRSSKRPRVGQDVQILGRDDAPCGPVATFVEVEGDGRAVVSIAGAADLGQLLDRAGEVPLPPYITRPDHAPEAQRTRDRDRYQTLHARVPGAVAAPTAGLHLTERIRAALAARGVPFCTVTLHVGPGTFLPVRTADLRAHRVLPERFSLDEVQADALDRARNEGRRLLAVGTTTVRCLETLAARHGDARFPAGHGEADLTILPGHRFGAVGAMLTNFHLPRSSLLVLVSTFAGRERVLSAYREAIARGFRFYSYGDAMLIL